MLRRRQRLAMGGECLFLRLATICRPRATIEEGKLMQRQENMR
jgi:hypothetical protein